MDLSFALEDLVNRRLTDVKLILIDNNGTIEFDCHKLVLCSLSKVFLKMFMFSESKTTYKMTVPNAIVTKHIIDLFYGASVAEIEPPWLFALELIQCRNFLCLETDLTSLFGIDIPNDGFELLLDVLDIFNSSNCSNLVKKTCHLVTISNYCAVHIMNYLSQKKNYLHRIHSMAQSRFGTCIINVYLVRSRLTTPIPLLCKLNFLLPETKLQF